MNAIVRRPAANLQPRMTAKDAARLMNVSERMVYMARELMATNRSDLVTKVEAGRMTMLGALKLAKPQKYGPKPGAGLKAIIVAWNKATEEERAWLLAKLGADQ
jgi:hypothetical protein